MRETQVRSLGWEDALEKEMATHSTTLVWKVSWMEEPGRLQFVGPQRAGHDWATSLWPPPFRIKDSAPFFKAASHSPQNGNLPRQKTSSSVSSWSANDSARLCRKWDRKLKATASKSALGRGCPSGSDADLCHAKGDKAKVNGCFWTFPSISGVILSTRGTLLGTFRRPSAPRLTHNVLSRWAVIVTSNMAVSALWSQGFISHILERGTGGFKGEGICFCS